MVADVTQRRHLALALHALTMGDSATFEDHLWLGFGDTWTNVLGALRKRRLVRYVASADAYELVDPAHPTVVRIINDDNANAETTANAASL